MADIIRHDFGKEDREHARRLARLLRLLEERDEDLLANPGKYFAMASERLGAQEDFIRSLEEAVRKPWQIKLDSSPAIRDEIEMVRIDKRDYEALQEIKRLLSSRKS